MSTDSNHDDDGENVVIFWGHDDPNNPHRWEAPIGDEGVPAWQMHRAVTWPPGADTCLCLVCQTRRTQARATHPDTHNQQEKTP